MTNTVLIHFQGTDNAKQHLNSLGLKYKLTDHEYDVIVDDVPYAIVNGIYQDPDVQLCEHYGIDYDLVNMIEAV